MSPVATLDPTQLYIIFLSWEPPQKPNGILYMILFSFFVCVCDMYEFILSVQVHLHAFLLFIKKKNTTIFVTPFPFCFPGWQNLLGRAALNPFFSGNPKGQRQTGQTQIGCHIIKVASDQVLHCLLTGFCIKNRIKETK